MKKTFWILAFLLVPVLGACRPALASESYWKNMKHDFVRGIKNVISSPLEIPVTIQEYHEKSGRPVIRHIAGFFDGAIRTVERAASGLWDFVVMGIPGDQEGVPPKPETFF